VSDPYVGEIRIFAGNFAPYGWMFCEGQVLPINGNEALYNLIGTTYGGNGRRSPTTLTSASS
jgi:microcystin-dependent protein